MKFGLLLSEHNALMTKLLASASGPQRQSALGLIPALAAINTQLGGYHIAYEFLALAPIKNVLKTVFPKLYEGITLSGLDLELIKVCVVWGNRPEDERTDTALEKAITQAVEKYRNKYNDSPDVQDALDQFDISQAIGKLAPVIALVSQPEQKERMFELVDAVTSVAKVETKLDDPGKMTPEIEAAIQSEITKAAENGLDPTLVAVYCASPKKLFDKINGDVFGDEFAAAIDVSYKLGGGNCTAQSGYHLGEAVAGIATVMDSLGTDIAYFDTSLDSVQRTAGIYEMLSRAFNTERPSDLPDHLEVGSIGVTLPSKHSACLKATMSPPSEGNAVEFLETILEHYAVIQKDALPGINFPCFSVLLEAVNGISPAELANHPDILKRLDDVQFYTTAQQLINLDDKQLKEYAEEQEPLMLDSYNAIPKLAHQLKKQNTFLMLQSQLVLLKSHAFELDCEITKNNIQKLLDEVDKEREDCSTDSATHTELGRCFLELQSYHTCLTRNLEQYKQHKAEGKGYEFRDKLAIEKATVKLLHSPGVGKRIPKNIFAKVLAPLIKWFSGSNAKALDFFFDKTALGKKTEAILPNRRAVSCLS